MKTKFFTQPVVLQNSKENRAHLEDLGYKPDKNNNLNHINIVTGDSSYYTVGCDQELLQDFSFPIWGGTEDCRNRNEIGLGFAACFKWIEIQQ